ncbi:MAG TPA: alpha/beta hydrolase [Candidatus Saccharimonadales bacterium]
MSLSDFTHEVAISADGSAISYSRLGTGPGLVIVHGTARSASDYDKLARSLAKSFTVYTVDRRGRGDSSPQGAAYSLEKECQDIVAVLRQTKALLLFGHSFGGVISLEVALSGYPLTKLALYEPALSVDHSISADSIPRIEDALVQKDYTRAFIEVIKIVGGDAIPEAQLPGFAQAVAKSPAWPQIRSLLPTVPAEIKAVSDADSTYLKYKAVTTETLLIHGTESPTYALMASKLLAQILPHAIEATVHGVGHNGPDTDAPEQVAAILTKFFT